MVTGAPTDWSRSELISGDKSLQYGSAAIVFMYDGRTMYETYRGDQLAAQWIEIQDLPPDKAMELVDFVGAHVEAHRQNP